MNIRANISQIAHSRNFRHGMLYTVFSFVNSGIGFILLLILARYLTPADYGSLNLFTTFVTLLNIVIALCTTAYITVSFFQKPKETLRQIILIAFGTTTGMLVLISMVMLLFPAFVERSVGVPIEYLWLGVMICYFGVFNSVNLDIWRLEEKPVYNHYANAGIYLIRREALRYIPKDKVFNATDLIDTLAADGQKVIRYPLTGLWIDIGTPEEYRHAQELIKHLR